MAFASVTTWIFLACLQTADKPTISSSNDGNGGTDQGKRVVKAKLVQVQQTMQGVLDSTKSRIRVANKKVSDFGSKDARFRMTEARGYENKSHRKQKEKT